MATTTALTTRTDGDLDTMTLGKILAQSGYFRDARDASQAIVKVLAGRELGISPIASMTGIFIVKEKVTLSANLIGAVIKRSGKYNYRVIAMDNQQCTIEFFEHGESIGLSEFTLKDAAAAGLTGGNWKAYPRNMLFARAMSNGAKWYTPDIFAGPIYTPDELGAEVDGETGEVVEQQASPVISVVQDATPTILERRTRTIEAIYDLWTVEQHSGGDLSVQKDEQGLGELSEYSNEGLGRLYRTVKARIDALPQQQQPIDSN
jgi:hypothetical protein